MTTSNDVLLDGDSDVLIDADSSNFFPCHHFHLVDEFGNNMKKATSFLVCFLELSNALLKCVTLHPQGDGLQLPFVAILLELGNEGAGIGGLGLALDNEGAGIGELGLALDNEGAGIGGLGQDLEVEKHYLTSLQYQTR